MAIIDPGWNRANFSSDPFRLMFDNYFLRTGTRHPADPKYKEWQEAQSVPPGNPSAGRGASPPEDGPKSKVPYVSLEVRRAADFLAANSTVRSDYITTSPERMKAAFREATQKLRPDLGRNHEASVQLNAAYATLKRFHGVR